MMKIFLIFILLNLSKCQNLTSICPGILEYTSDGKEVFGLVYFTGGQSNASYMLDVRMNVWEEFSEVSS